MNIRILAKLKNIVLIALISVGFSQSAQAVPILGGQLFYTGGDVTVTSLAVSSGFTSELNFYDSALTEVLYLMNDEPPGVTVTFNPFDDYGIAIGSELIFGIQVVDTGDEFFMGGAARNPDSIEHATVDNIGGGMFIVGFEDLFGGGDFDYDDNVFEFTGGLITNVPEPATLALLGLGLVGMGIIRRRRSI